MYKLKSDISYANLLKNVERCEGEVLFCTLAGDSLNLKSRLSQFIFAAAVTNPDLIQGGCLVCDCESDYLSLSSYLTQTEG